MMCRRFCTTYLNENPYPKIQESCVVTALGQGILQSMNGKSVAEYAFRKKDQVTTLASYTYITVEGERLEIDP